MPLMEHYVTRNSREGLFLDERKTSACKVSHSSGVEQATGAKTDSACYRIASDRQGAARGDR
jgi:hypothetical protein